MPQTSTWSLPYPTGTQVPNVPADLQALAVATDTALSAATAFVGGEVRASAQQTNLAGGQGNRLQFGTIVKAPAGVGWNGLDTWTIQADGVYAGFVNLRTSANPSSGAVHITGTAYSDATLLFPGDSTTNGYGDFSQSFGGFLTAGTLLCAYFYNASATTASAFSTRPPMFKLWRTT
jgi:hypothetical protein